MNLEFTAEIQFIGRRDEKDVISLNNGMFVEGDGIIDAVKQYEAQAGAHIPRAAWNDGKWVLEGTYVDVINTNKLWGGHQ